MHILSFYFLIASSALRLDTNRYEWKWIPNKLADMTTEQDERELSEFDGHPHGHGHGGGDSVKEYEQCERNESSYMPITGPNPFSTIRRRPHYPGFNPAIAQLPAGIGNDLHPEAFYVMATKLSHNQCQVFCYPKHRVQWHLWTKKATQYASAISILDKSLKVILGPIVIPGGEDMRLLAIDNILLADYHFKGANWELRQLHLGMTGGVFSAALGAVSFGQMDRLSPAFKGQNIGLIAQNSEIYGLWWLNHTATRETRKITSNGKTQEVTFAKEVEAKPKNPPRYEVHNSVHPLWLPEHNQYLGAAHFAAAPWGKHGVKFASEYLQYLILFESKPPFKMLKRTPSFCFPTQDAAHDGKCEVIQYVSGITRNPERPDELLISYGLNDCESMLAKVSLKTVLNLMSNVENFDSPIEVKKFVRTPMAAGKL